MSKPAYQRSMELVGKKLTTEEVLTVYKDWAGTYDKVWTLFCEDSKKELNQYSFPIGKITTSEK